MAGGTSEGSHPEDGVATLDFGTSCPCTAVLRFVDSSCKQQHSSDTKVTFALDCAAACAKHGKMVAEGAASSSACSRRIRLVVVDSETHGAECLDGSEETSAGMVQTESTKLPCHTTDGVQNRVKKRCPAKSHIATLHAADSCRVERHAPLVHGVEEVDPLHVSPAADLSFALGNRVLATS